jgi:hypothetical protein
VLGLTGTSSGDHSHEAVDAKQRLRGDLDAAVQSAKWTFMSLPTDRPKEFSLISILQGMRSV